MNEKIKEEYNSTLGILGTLPCNRKLYHVCVVLETTTVADQSSKASSPLRLCPSSATSTTAAATSRRQQRNGQQTAPNNHRTSEENSTTTTIRNKESKRKQQSGNKQSFKGKQHQVNTNSSTRAHHSSIINNQGKSYHNSQNPTAIEMQSAGFTLPASSPNGGGNSSSSATALSSSSSNGSSSNGAGGGKNYSSSYKVLTFEQFTKLDNLMNSDIEIHGQGTFPNIKVRLINRSHLKYNERNWFVCSQTSLTPPPLMLDTYPRAMPGGRLRAIHPTLVSYVCNCLIALIRNFVLIKPHNRVERKKSEHCPLVIG